MALKAGSVQPMPDLACIGLVKRVGEVYLSEKGVYHVLPLEIEAKFGGRDGVFFYIFEPRWFGKNFDPETLLREEKKGTKYSMYRRSVNDEKRPSILACLVGDKFPEVAAELDAIDEVDEKHVEELIRKYATGNDVGYIMVQRKDEEKNLMEQYNIQRFFPLTDEELQKVTEQAKGKRRQPLVVTLDE